MSIASAILNKEKGYLDIEMPLFSREIQEVKQWKFSGGTSITCVKIEGKEKDLETFCMDLVGKKLEFAS